MGKRFVAVVLMSLAAAACNATEPLPSQTAPTTLSPSAMPTARPTPPPVPTPTATPAALVTDSAGGWTFKRPANWVASLPTGYDPLQGGVGYFLSNFPLRADCVVDPAKVATPLPTATPSCLVPFGTIPAGGIYIETYGSRTVNQLPSGGEPIEVLGRASRLELDRPGRCATQVTDEVMKVPIPDGANDYHVLIIACLMGPDVEQTERQFREFLASITVQP